MSAGPLLAAAKPDSAEAPTAQAELRPSPRRAELVALRRIAAAILVLMMAAAIYFARDLLQPVTLGALIALTFSPLVRAAARRGLPAPLSAVALILVIGGGGVGAALSIGGTAAEFADEAPRLGALLRIRLAGISESVEAVKNVSEEVEKIAGGGEEPGRVVVAPPGLLSSALDGMASAGATLAVAFTVALFLLAGGRGLHVKVVRSFSRFRDKRSALETVLEIEQRISRYLLTITLINAGLGLCVFAAFFAIGMPYPYLWGVGAFLLNFMPYVGTVVGVALSGAIGIVTFDTLGYAALAPVAYLALGSFEGQVVTPAILGRRLEIDSVAVLLSLVFWTWAWGVAGALIAVPMLVVFKTIAERTESLAGVARLLEPGEGPVAPPGD